MLDIAGSAQWLPRPEPVNRRRCPQRKRLLLQREEGWGRSVIHAGVGPRGRPWTPCWASTKEYLAQRAALITDMDMGTAAPGDIEGFDPAAPDPTAKTSGTSHISIVDRHGNALSMTTTIESSFGNGVMVRGFLLNNELTDFSFAFENDGVPIANRVQPNKRPRSSMSPTIVFDPDGKVELVTGSPGGSRIIGYTAQSIVNHIDFELDPQESINTPHYQHRNGGAGTKLETPIPGVTLDYDRDALRAALDARGHSTSDSNTLTSGLSIIHVDGERLVGGADKRRDGTVAGR